MTQILEIEHFGESLTTHPDYLMMKRMYEEQEFYEKELLENTQECIKFVPPVLENTDNFIGRQEVKENEENVLRNPMESLRA